MLTVSLCSVWRIKDVMLWNGYLYDCCFGGGRPAAACLSLPGVSERQVHVEPISTPLPANGRKRLHGSPKINPDPSVTAATLWQQSEASQDVAPTGQHIRFYHFRALKVGSQGHPGVLKGCTNDLWGGFTVCSVEWWRLRKTLFTPHAWGAVRFLFFCGTSMAFWELSGL